MEVRLSQFGRLEIGAGGRGVVQRGILKHRGLELRVGQVRGRHHRSAQVGRPEVRGYYSYLQESYEHVFAAVRDFRSSR